MVAAVETMAYRFKTEQDIPWHKLGVQVPEGEHTLEHMWEMADLNWEVQLRPLRNVHGQIISDTREVVRVRPVMNIDGLHDMGPDLVPVNDETYYGTVGAGFQLVQNNEVKDVLDNLNPDRPMMVDTLGSLKEGARCWVLLQLGESIKLGGVQSELLIPYVLADWGHNGQAAISFRTCWTRVVCANTLAMAYGEHRPYYSVKHTKNAAERMKQAGQRLGLIANDLDWQAARFEQWANEQATEELTEKVFNIVAPEPKAGDTALVTKRAKDARFELWKLHQEAPTVAAAGRDTKWGLFNAVTEFMEHHEFRKGMMADSKNGNAEERRIFDNLEGAKNEERRNAVVKELMKV